MQFHQWWSLGTVLSDSVGFCWRAVIHLLVVLLEWLRFVLVLWQDMTTSSRSDLVLKTHGMKSCKFRGLGSKHLTILYFCTLAWKIPWTEEPGRLQSMGSLRVGHDWASSLSFFTFMHWRRKWQPTPVFLPGESQGWGSLVGCRLWGRTESDTTEVT